MLPSTVKALSGAPLRTLGLVALALAFAALVGAETSAELGSPSRQQAEPSSCQLGARLRDSGGLGALVLGCVDTPGLSRLKLLAVGDDSGAGPCLEIVGIDHRGSRGCGRAPLERVPPSQGPVTFDATAHAGPGLPIEVYGGISASVASVELTYDVRGHRVSRTATVIAVSNPKVLRKAGIDAPFGYFAGKMPVRFFGCRAVAYGSGGRRLGSARCEPFEGLPQDAFIIGGRYGWRRKQRPPSSTASSPVSARR